MLFNKTRQYNKLKKTKFQVFFQVFFLPSLGKEIFICKYFENAHKQFLHQYCNISTYDSVHARFG